MRICKQTAPRMSRFYDQPLVPKYPLHSLPTLLCFQPFSEADEQSNAADGKTALNRLLRLEEAAITTSKSIPCSAGWFARNVASGL